MGGTTFRATADVVSALAGLRDRLPLIPQTVTWARQFAASLPDEIAALADSMYVSFYKGLGGLTGAALVGSADVITEARLWRRRLGGTTYRATAEVVSALVGLRDRLPLIPDTVRWARELAAALPSGLAVQPAVPQTNQFLVFASGDADAVNERTAAAIDEHGIGLPVWSATEQPGRITTEVVVSPTALGLDPAAMAGLVASVVG